MKALLALVLLLAASFTLPLLQRSQRAPFLAEASLGDGRILRVESVSFGKIHQAGQESLVIRTLGPWLPSAVREYFEPSIPRNRIEQDEDSLVIWVNAIDEITRTNLDCQGLRVELIDPAGPIFSGQPHWFGGQKFWRVGHVFDAFPRNSRTLNLRVTPWKRTNSVEFALSNPGFREGERWTGHQLPLTQAVEHAQVVLASLTFTTNQSTYWKSASPFWTPQFEIFWHSQKQTSGWDLEWTSQDRYGNRGRELGTAESVLKFEANFFPSATNLQAAILVTNLPPANPQTQTPIWWNLSAPVNRDQVTILGLFPAGVQTFSEGEHLTNPPVAFSPVRGGAPSGWVSQSRRVTPSRTESFNGHYSDVPVIYVRVSNPKSSERIGIRLKTADGRAFHAQPEPQGGAGPIIPFLLKLPPEIDSVQAGLVRLPRFSAQFLANTAHSPP